MLPRFRITDAARAKHAACKENNGIWQDIQVLSADFAEQNRKSCSLKAIVARATSARSTRNVLHLERIQKVVLVNVVNTVYSFVKNRRLRECTECRRNSSILHLSTHFACLV